MLKLAKVKTCELADLFKTINKGVSMYKKLSRGFGNVEVVFKESLDGHKSFVVEAFERTLLENFLKEHFAKSCGKLINKSSNTEVFVVDNALFGVEHLAYLDRNLRFLEGAGKILDIFGNGSDADDDFLEKFGACGIDNGICNLFKLTAVAVGLYFLDKNNVVFADADNVILVLFGEHILHYVIGHNVGKLGEANEEYGAGNIAVKAKFLCFDINITGENVIQDDVFDKAGFVILFVINCLDVVKRNCKNGSDLVGCLVISLNHNNIFKLCMGADGTVGVVTVNESFVIVGNFI